MSPETVTDETAYAFTEDYVSAWLPIWSQQFGHLKGRPQLKILEIGSYEGRSTVWFLEQLLTGHDASITCVDPFYAPGTEERFDANIEASGAADRVIKVKQRSDEYLGTTPTDSFHLIYIDGGHDAPTVLWDAMMAWPLLADNGMLMFDDYGWEPERPAHDRPKLAIDVFLDNYRGEYDVCHAGYQVIVRRRKGRRGDWTRVTRPSLLPGVG